MTHTFQPGVHPDVESLSAFVEQALPAAEREQIVAHMAVCERCRQVVFLAQEAVEDKPAPRQAVEAPKIAPLPSWLGIWRWAWVPMGAIALLAGVAVLRFSYRPSSQQQMAKVEPSEQAPRASASVMNAPATPAASMVAPQTDSFAKDEKALDARRDAGVAGAKKAENQLSVAREGSVAGAEAQAPVMQAEGAPAQADAIGALHGNAVVAGNNSNAGRADGPREAQNQLSQLKGLNQMQAAQPAANGYGIGGGFGAAEKEKASANAPLALSPVNPSAAPNPARLSANTTVSVSSAAAMDETVQVTPMRKASRMQLPSGLAALSTAKVEQRVVAIDPSGAMFLSEDDGVRWAAIPRQWTGRAVLLRVRQTIGTGGLAATTPAPVFELTNDNLQTWESADGRTWVAVTPPPK